MDELIRRGDPEELLREVDRLCAAGDWDGVLALRDRCEAAVELGKQLWPIARYAEYRVALEAPGPYAAGVCRPTAARFTLGPLTEVAAATHTWDELADHLPSPWAAASVAQERVIRGEDLAGDDRAHPEELELPLVLEAWEPDYPLPVYRPHEILEGGPPPVDATFETVEVADPPTGARPDVERALREVGATWAGESNGACRVVSVIGDGRAAVGALFGEARVTPIRLEHALARLAWSAASGGAYGRRRGMAAGRSSAHWVCHVATGLDFPADPSRLGEAARALRWFAVDGASDGWRLRLAVEDPRGGWAAAIDAWDEELIADDDVPPGEASTEDVTAWLLGRQAGNGTPHEA